MSTMSRLDVTRQELNELGHHVYNVRQVWIDLDPDLPDSLDDALYKAWDALANCLLVAVVESPLDWDNLDPQCRDAIRTPIR